MNGLGKGLFSKWCKRGFGWRYCIFSRWRFQIFLFSPLFGKISNLSSIFFRWVVQPPTSFFAYILRFGKKCIFLSYDPTGNPYAVESSNKFSFITFDWPWLRDFFVLLNIGWSWFLNFDPPSKNLRSTLFLIQGHKHIFEADWIEVWKISIFSFTFFCPSYTWHTNERLGRCFFCNGTNFGPTGVTTTLHQSDRAPWDFWCDGKCWRLFCVSLPETDSLPLNIVPWKRRFLLESPSFGAKC